MGYDRGSRMEGIRMSEEYGSDFITVTDEDGEEFVLEHLDTIEQGDALYMAFVPADMDEDHEDYGIVILRVLEENGEELLATVEDETELNAVYETFMKRLFEEEAQ